MRPARMLLFSLLLASFASGDILITKTGRIFVGRLDPDNEERQTVTMRWPYKGITDKGAMTFYLEREVRWHKRGVDAPDESYWGEYAQEELDTSVASRSALTQEELNQILTERANKLLERLQGEGPATTIRPSDTTGAAPIVVSRASELTLGEREVDRAWRYGIRIPDGWEGGKHQGIHFWVGPEENGFQPQIHVMFFGEPPVKSLMGEHGLVSLTLDVSKNFATAYDAARISPVEKDPAGDTQKCVAEVVVEQGERRIFSRKVFIITGNQAFILASYDLEENVELRDKVIRQALASFEITE